MNNLPTTFEGLLALLRQFVEESTDHTFGTFDPETIGEKVDTLVTQYDAKEQPGPRVEPDEESV